MTRVLYVKRFLFIFICISMFSCSSEDEGIFFTETYRNKEDYSKMETEILDIVNSYRLTIKLQPLNRLNSISSVAQSHTNYMVETGLVNHTDFPSRSSFLITNEDAVSVGENVGYGYRTSQAVVNAWIKSVKHRAIIEKENYTDFGISVKKNSEGRNFFTQIFIEK